MSRPVIIGALADRDIREARAGFDGREPGLGDQFVGRVNETVRRIAFNPELYRPIFGDARRAPSSLSQYSVWYRVAPDSSIVIACLSDRRDLSLARRRALKPLEPL